MASACWLAHKSVGLDETGYGKIIGDTIQMTKRLSTKLRDIGRPYADFIEVMNDPELNVLCFRLVFREKSLQEQNRINREFYKKMNEDRIFFLSCTDELRQSEGDKEAPLAVRVCIMNPFTGDYYIERFVNEVKKHIDRIRQRLSDDRLGS